MDNRWQIRLLRSMCLLGLMLAPRWVAGELDGFILVEDGQAGAVLVLPDRAHRIERTAAAELQYHVQRASGAVLEIVPESKLPETDRGRVYIGNTRRARAVGLDPAMIEEDAFHIRVTPRELFLVGNQENPTADWAVDDLLDRYLGVRWLWPGELGTFVPRTATVILPVGETEWQHPYIYRLIRHRLNQMPRELGDYFRVASDDLERMWSDVRQWHRRHRSGNRKGVVFGHAFGRWWAQYGVEHPDLFAYPPEGFQQPYPHAGRVKLRLGNPEVDEFILREWRATGSPPFWNVSPNDGAGFCAHPDTLAMDEPPDQDPLEVWRVGGWSQLTARYVRFWNRLVGKMRAEQPDAVLCTYFYARYSEPPPEGVRLEPGILGGIVLPYDERFYTMWDGWHAAGAEQMILRPGWLRRGSGAPYTPIREIESAFRHAAQNGMAGFQIGAIYGAWANKGISYYLMARLSWRPELSLDDIINEYASAFGSGAPLIRDYLLYWADFATDVALPYGSAGEFRWGLGGGRYEQVAAGLGLESPRFWMIAPHLYTENTLDKAFALLDAAAVAASGEGEALSRIEFLRNGLQQFQLLLQTLEARREAESGDPEAIKRYLERFGALAALRQEITPSHAVWGGLQFRREPATAPLKTPTLQKLFF